MTCTAGRDERAVPDDASGFVSHNRLYLFTNMTLQKIQLHCGCAPLLQRIRDGQSQIAGAAHGCRWSLYSIVRDHLESVNGVLFSRAPGVVVEGHARRRPQRIVRELLSDDVSTLHGAERPNLQIAYEPQMSCS